MDPKRFGTSSSGKVVKIGKGETAYWAFLPHSLPPDLSLGSALFSALSDADRALGELAGLARNLSNPHLLINPFIRKEAVLSSRIEGTQADISDLYAYEASQLPLLPGTNTRDSDVFEVRNYVRALEYGIERLKDFPISLRFIREVHERLMNGVRGGHATPGEFRTGPNWIGGRGLNDAVYVPPPAEEMRHALDAFEKYLHNPKGYPPLVQLALIHAQFEMIHPFVDGNGRSGRLLITLLLLHWNLLPLPLLYLSAYFERYRDEYCALLQSVSEKGNWLEWTIFFLNGVTSQSKDAIARSKRLQDLQTEWRKELTKSRASARLLQLVDILFAVPITTVPFLRTELASTMGSKVSYQGVQNMIKRLEATGMVTARDIKGSARLYKADRIVEIVSD